MFSAFRSLRLSGIVQALCFALCLGLTACSSDQIQVLSFSPTGEVDAYTTFQVDFSAPLAPPEAIGEWQDEAFIAFEPPLQGRFKWLSPSTLIFSPEKALKPGQDYTARITEEVFFGKSGQASDFDPQSFHTPYFDAVKVDFFWTQIPRSNFKVTVQANLHFNYEVDPK
ncbi:MAG: hypothetical protein AAF570_22090, partial [Bacteroidota bacterium]